MPRFIGLLFLLSCLAVFVLFLRGLFCSGLLISYLVSSCLAALPALSFSFLVYLSFALTCLLLFLFLILSRLIFVLPSRCIFLYSCVFEPISNSHLLSCLLVLSNLIVSRLVSSYLIPPLSCLFYLCLAFVLLSSLHLSLPLSFFLSFSVFVLSRLFVKLLSFDFSLTCNHTFESFLS